ncbi:MAG: hypothetical protein KF791_08065 [Verrucomicrobiae bacterium]|nr:hypothetical protein [Verrucomicrobiae bacterium]
MEPVESRLLTALMKLDAAVGSGAADVRPLLAALDRMTGELPSSADPELVHFLRRRSYEKARLFLLGRREAIQRGGCLRDREA